MIKFLDLHSQYLSIRSEIDAAIASTLQNSAYIGGAAVQVFEDAFASYHQANYCVGVANGTDAIEIALEALQLPKGSEVIVPANTFIATSEAVTRAGHQVVFADIDPATYTLQVSDVRKRISARTRAVVAVHLYGHPCDMEALDRLVTEFELQLIEDCAQAHGAEYRGRRVGTIGKIGTFSFYPGKNLGAYGDGGCIVTNDEDLARRCRMIANHGRIDKYDHLFEGRNSRLDGLQAAVLSVKLKHLDKWIDKRIAVSRRYTEALSNVEELTVPFVHPDVRHAFHLFVVRSADRDGLSRHLAASGIQTGIHYPIALPKLAAYAHLGQHTESMVANKLDSQLLSLPIGEHLTDQDVGKVVDSIKAFFVNHASTSTRSTKNAPLGS